MKKRVKKILWPTRYTALAAAGLVASFALALAGAAEYSTIICPGEICQLSFPTTCLVEPCKAQGATQAFWSLMGGAIIAALFALYGAITDYKNQPC